jgi:hypothetical protein
MRTIRVLLVVFITVVVLLFLGVGIAAYTGMSADGLADIFRFRSSFSVFRDAAYGISFRYPKEWKWTYVPPNNILFRSGDGVVMTLALSKRKEAETLQEVGEKNRKEIFESSQNEGIAVEMEPVIFRFLSSLPAESFIYHTAREDARIDGMQVVAVKDTKEYSMTLASPHDRFAAAVQTFENVLESMQITR